jgi:hypothetical protein
MPAGVSVVQAFGATTASVGRPLSALGKPAAVRTDRVVRTSHSGSNAADEARASRDVTIHSPSALRVT